MMGNRTIRRQTNSQSVKSRTGRFVDWATCQNDQRKN